MMTYIEAVKAAQIQLQQAGIEEYAVDAVWLLTELFGWNRTQYLLKQRDTMSEDELDVYRKAVERRVAREPLQYIVGHGYFMGYTFKTTPAVLIPRHDTECLVEQVEVILNKMQPKDTYQILDMCTGSGCIGISLALRNANTQVVAADISSDALDVACENARNLECNSIQFVQSDLMENVVGTFDIIVSNPPYIRTDVIEQLMNEVKDHEPFNALDGHADGLFFYEKITETAESYLKPEGYLCYEIGYDQGEAVKNLMENRGFKECQVFKDLAGLDRVVIGKKLD